MPELPEVETIRRGLEQLIVGMTIAGVEVRMGKMFTGDHQSIIAATIQSIRRRGKGLMIDLDNGYSLAVHVKMTGQLIFRVESNSVEVEAGSVTSNVTPKEKIGKQIRNLHPALDVPAELPSKHTHVIFRLRAKGVEHKDTSAAIRHSGKPEAHPESPGDARDSGQAGMTKSERNAMLFYNDIRQFGWIKVVKTSEVEQLPFFTSLGPEPLTNLDVTTFAQILSRSKAPIKQVLMDQSRMAGIGNIYANDALFYAHIHPLRPANSLSEEEMALLFEGVEYVLTEGIKAGGASEENYVNAFGEKGFYQEKFLVYMQTGKPCKRCGTPIERIVIGGRGTFLCPSCQV